MNWAEISWFTPAEFQCGCGCGKNNAKPQLVRLLDYARKQIQAPIIITSGCRCEKHNEAIGGAPRSKHRIGLAADVATKQYLMNGLEKVLNRKGTWIKRYPSHIHVHLDES